MGTTIVITSKNVNVSNEIIQGITHNIFPSGLSGQDFQTLCFIAAKGCNSFVISHMFSCQMFPQLSAIQIMSYECGGHFDCAREQAGFMGCLQRSWAIAVISPTLGHTKESFPHTGTSPFLMFLAMVNRTHSLAPVRGSNCTRSLMKTWWWFCGRPQILPRGPAMHQSCSVAQTQSLNKCFLKVQDRLTDK